MAITRESAREMSDEALAFTLNDLNEVIAICERWHRETIRRAPLLPITANHSRYLDERFAIIEAMVARRPSQLIANFTRVRDACMNCGAPATMNASLGPACPDCYDDLSD
jgi:hypothetical protein